VIDGKLDARPSPLAFWDFNTRRYLSDKPQPYIDPELQKGTTPLVKRGAGKATRDFRNFRYPAINDADYIGARSIIVGDHKLVIHERKQGEPNIELFNLKTDPAEKTNLAASQPDLARKLQTDLRQWQKSVLNSLTGADYRPAK
jgi:arylsulfatase A-like enzyme